MRKALINIYLVLSVLIFIVGCKSNKGVNSSSSKLSQQDIKFNSLYIDACTQFNISNYSIALEKFKECTKLKPQEANVYYQLSRVTLKLNQTGSTVFYASKAHQLANDNIYYAIFYAQYLQQLRQFQDAEKVIKTTQKTHAKSTVLFEELSSIYYYMGKKNLQIENYKNWLNANGFQPILVKELIQLLSDEKRFSEAHDWLNQLIQSNPLNESNYLLQAKIFETENKPLKAIESYKKALNINPNQWEINIRLYKFYTQENDFEKANEYLKNAMNDVEEEAKNKIEFTQKILEKTPLTNTSKNSLQIIADKMVELHYSNASALMCAATIYDSLNQLENANKLYNRIVKLNPNEYEAWHHILDNLYKENNFNEMSAVGSKVVELFPTKASAYLMLATANNYLGKYDKSIEASKAGSTWAENDDETNLLAQQAWAYYGLKDIQKSKEIVEKLVDYTTTNAYVYFILGNICWKENKIEKAKQMWKKAQLLGLNYDILNRQIEEGKLYE